MHKELGRCPCSKLPTSITNWRMGKSERENIESQYLIVSKELKNKRRSSQVDDWYPVPSCMPLTMSLKHSCKPNTNYLFSLHGAGAYVFQDRHKETCSNDKILWYSRYVKIIWRQSRTNPFWCKQVLYNAWSCKKTQDSSIKKTTSRIRFGKDVWKYCDEEIIWSSRSGTSGLFLGMMHFKTNTTKI